jgi:hypothetical protein
MITQGFVSTLLTEIVITLGTRESISGQMGICCAAFADVSKNSHSIGTCPFIAIVRYTEYFKLMPCRTAAIPRPK